MWYWWWGLMPPPDRPEKQSARKAWCDAHKGVEEAAAANAKAHAKGARVAQEARHSLRNVRMLFHAMADRLGRHGHGHV
jgi:hypothetical protein